MSEQWTSRLWAGADSTYRAILAHPFLRGLRTGTLDETCFGYYLAQDALYLREYARTLAIVGAKAPAHADVGLLAQHAADTVAVELALHETLLPQLGLDPAALSDIPASPTTTAYTSYLLATAYGATFAQGLAAVLPCYWIYQRVGAELLEQGSPDPRYQRWIDTYAGDAFAVAVAEVLALADRIGPELSASEREGAQRHFATTARYEWMFWDAAWRRESWPL